MSYAILRVARLKRAPLARALAHNHRERRPANADPTQSERNRYYSNPAAASEQVREAIRQTEAQTGRRVRKDATVAAELVLTASPQHFAGQDSKVTQQFMKAAQAWLTREFGKDNIASLALHRDEKTPHLHALIIPRAPDGKLSYARSKLGGRPENLSRLQDRYAEAMKPLGLARGQKKSRAKHQTIRRWYGKLNDAVKALARSKERERAATDKIEELAGKIDALKSRLSDELHPPRGVASPEMRPTRQHDHGPSL